MLDCQYTGNIGRLLVITGTNLLQNIEVYFKRNTVRYPTGTVHSFRVHSQLPCRIRDYFSLCMIVAIDLNERLKSICSVLFRSNATLIGAHSIEIPLGNKKIGF